MAVARMAKERDRISRTYYTRNFGKTLYNIVIILNLGCCLTLASAQRPNPCKDEIGKPQRCIPEFINAAFNVLVEATNTCGNPPIEYCFQTGATGAVKHCEQCNAANPRLSHPPQYLTDFNNNDNMTWWQSETMLEGIQFPHSVNLTLRLGKSFDITYVRLKFHSSRPESFVIYKRTKEDGPWIPYQYYSGTCRDTYGLSDSSFVTREDETKALCTSDYSDISPLTGGNVAFSTLEGRPSAYNFEDSPQLQEWVTATDIMITLNRLNTFGDEIFGDHNVLRSYYYAVSDFAVGGRCKCNGHASRCEPSTGYGQRNKLICLCEHNTDGPDCEKCKPGFHDRPWARATAADANECKKCDCNGKSERCYFDEELYRRTRSGGHCIDCQDNTYGPHCERCKDNFYKRSDNVCVFCNCDETGSTSTQCDERGKCVCKSGIGGDRCNECLPNHYDFSPYGCRECQCSVAGSLVDQLYCHPQTGACRCKDQVEGLNCDKCKPGYFDLQQSNTYGCLKCFCYGHSSKCERSNGYVKTIIETNFKKGAQRWSAVTRSGQSVPTQFNSIVQNLGVSSTSAEPVYFLASDRYLGDQRFSYNQFLTFTLRIGGDDPRPSRQDVIIEGNGQSISLQIYAQRNPTPTQINQDYKFHLHEHSDYEWLPRLETDEFQKILANITAIKIRGSYNIQDVGFLDNVGLGSAQRGSHGEPATHIERCRCPEGFVGQFCESCAPGYRRQNPRSGAFSHCIPCECNKHSDVCDIYTGSCICQHNTEGNYCERCANGYYGNALLGTPHDCKPCPCPGQSPCREIRGEVVCLECPTGYAGRRCEMCADGYFGDPEGRYGPPRQCTRCECSGNIDPNGVGNCNTTTGECLKCEYNTGGFFCETCLPGYYGNALAIPKGQCKACGCYPHGTIRRGGPRTPLICDPVDGACPCETNVIGRRCDKCAEGYWNIDSGRGCERCYCDAIGSLNYTCNIQTGQCNCKPGVGEQHCDKCLPRYYGFSIDGCRACDCNYDGSANLQCDLITGQCECRINVEGRTCDRCQENKYNKTAGCINCPPCYNLVQKAVNEHRGKMDELHHILNSINSTAGKNIDDDFEEKLDEVKEKVNKLLEDAENAGNGDADLAKKLNDLLARVAEVKKVAGKIQEKADLADDVSDQAKENITMAENDIAQALAALRNARDYLDIEGKQALEAAKEASKRFGQQSERMSRIAKEAKELADEQEKKAEEIESVALEALNTSQEAYRMVADAYDKHKEINHLIKRLENGLLDAESLLNETRKAAEDAQNLANKAYNDALDLYSKYGDYTLPTVDVQQLLLQAAQITGEAKRIQADAESLLNSNKDTLDGLQNQMNESENLLDKAMKQQQLLDEMLADVDAAKDKAAKAVKKGEGTLKEANKTLETLKGFDKLVQDSKEKSDVAKKKIPEIEAVIEEAEEKTRDAEDDLSDALQIAIDARDIAEEAQTTAQNASEEAGKIKNQADETKTKAEQLKDDAEKLAGLVTETDNRLKGLETQAKEDEKLVDDALKKAEKARTQAKASSDEIENALGIVQDILDKLEKLDALDKDRLANLEKELKEAEDQLSNANLEVRLNEMKQATKIQMDWVRDYEEELKHLYKEVANVRAISEAVPTKCFKRLKLEP